MLGLALKSHIPLIRVVTNDLVNVRTVLNAHLGKTKFVETDVKNIYINIKKKEYLYVVAPTEGAADWEKLYHAICMADEDRCVVVVNPDENSPTFFDCGDLTVPRTCLRAFVTDFADKSEVDGLVRSLTGLTLKEAGEVCRMAQLHGGSLTQTTIAQVRRFYAPPEKGLAHVSTTFPHYHPDFRIVEWLKLDGKIFMMNGKVPAPLVPRGLLLKGAPGTGKTLAAKFLASELGLPLYRLDLGAALNKYIGESENNVDAALKRIDTLAPAILLIDEVEKLFMGNDETGTAKRILSTMLWWLQEHKSRVFTVFTSNDIERVPPELVRPGRVDEHIELRGLETPEEKRDYIRGACKGVKATDKTTNEIVKKATAKVLGSFDTQAQLTKWTYDQLKAYL